MTGLRHPLAMVSAAETGLASQVITFQEPRLTVQTTTHLFFQRMRVGRGTEASWIALLIHAALKG